MSVFGDDDFSALAKHFERPTWLRPPSDDRFDAANALPTAETVQTLIDRLATQASRATHLPVARVEALAALKSAHESVVVLLRALVSAQTTPAITEAFVVSSDAVMAAYGSLKP